MKAPAITELMPHQKEGLRRAKKIGGPIFINSDTGTGKSKLAIGIARQSLAARGLVVAPGAVLQAKWVEELASMGYKAQVLTKPKFFDPECDWWVTSYQSIMFGLRDTIYGLRDRLECVIFDESHALKTRDAKRTQAWRQYVAPLA